MATNKFQANHPQRHRNYPDKDFCTTPSPPRMHFFGYRCRDYPDRYCDLFVTALAFRYLWPLPNHLYLQMASSWVWNGVPHK
jgi:hypothetical protein